MAINTLGHDVLEGPSEKVMDLDHEEMFDDDLDVCEGKKGLNDFLGHGCNLLYLNALLA